MSLVTITIPHLASGSLTKAHRAGSNYQRVGRSQQEAKCGSLNKHQGEELRKIIQSNYPKDQWGHGISTSSQDAS